MLYSTRSTECSSHHLPRPGRRLSARIVMLLMALLLLNASAMAEVKVQAYYRCGEADAVEGSGKEATASVTRDSSGNGRDMIHVLGKITYTTDTPRNPPGSKLALKISEGGTCYSDDVKGFGLQGLQRGWGMEGWFLSRTANEANADGSPAEKWFLGMGNPHVKNGMAIAQLGEEFVGILNGIIYVQADPPLKVKPGQWVHLALVADHDGNTKLYVDGDLRVTRNASPGPLQGKDGALIGVRPGGASKVKDGAVDELRIFTFEGQFDPRDLLVNRASLPPDSQEK